MNVNENNNALLLSVHLQYRNLRNKLIHRNDGNTI